MPLQGLLLKKQIKHKTRPSAVFSEHRYRHQALMLFQYLSHNVRTETQTRI